MERLVHDFFFINASDFVGEKFGGSMYGAPPSAYSYKFVGAFSCAQIDLRKARERELATLDEKSTSSGIAEPYARKKIEGKSRGGEGTTPVTTACPEAGK